MKFGLKKRTIVYTSRETRFASEFDYFYILKEGKIEDEGEKQKISEKFSNLPSDKLRNVEGPGNQIKSMIIHTSKINQDSEESRVDLSIGKKEMNSLLTSPKILLITMIVFYLSLICGLAKLLLFRYYTLLLYQMGDSKNINLVVNYSSLFGLLYFSFPLYEYMVRSVLCRLLSCSIHAKILYRMIMSPSTSSSLFNSQNLKLSREITDLDHIDIHLPESIMTSLYQLSYITTCLTVIYLIGNLGAAAFAVMVVLTIFLLISKARSRENFLEMQDFLHSKWLVLNLDSYNGISVIRACNYSLFFRMKLFYLEEKKNMIRLYLIGARHLLGCLAYFLMIFLGFLPMLAASYIEFDLESHIPCVGLNYVFIFYLPLIFQNGLYSSSIALDSKSELERLMRVSKEKFEKTRNEEEQVAPTNNEEITNKYFKTFHSTIVNIEDAAVVLNEATALVTGETVLIQGFSLKIQRGEHIAIVYEKSPCSNMICKLILKMAGKYKGKVEFLGEEVSGIPGSIVRERIFYLDFECGVFEGTLAENLNLDGGMDFFNTNIEMETMNLLQSFGYSHDAFTNMRLGMWIDPTKLDSVDRLIIGMTRCVLECKYNENPPSLILLDGVDSRFSVETYSRMKMLVERELSQFTILMICSIPKVAHLMDECIVMKDDRIVERGKVNELEKRQNSEYSKLIQSDLIDR